MRHDIFLWEQKWEEVCLRRSGFQSTLNLWMENFPAARGPSVVCWVNYFKTLVRDITTHTHTTPRAQTQPPGLCLSSLHIPPLHKLKWPALAITWRSAMTWQYAFFLLLFFLIQYADDFTICRWPVWTIILCPHTGSVHTTHLLLGLRRALWSSPSSASSPIGRARS